MYWGWEGKEHDFQATHALLVRCDLRHVAHVCEILTSLRVAADDPRLARLLGELDAAGIEYGTRARRRYSQRERDAADWLFAPNSTSMVTAGSAKWIVDDVCPTCGSGCRAEPPLEVSVDRINESGFMVTGPWSYIVARDDVAAAILNAGLTGCRIRPVRRTSRKSARINLVWLETLYTWPRVSPHSALVPRYLCDQCFRAGFSDDTQDAPLLLDYESAPNDAPDFGVTYEQFGALFEDVEPRRGAAPRLILSQRARSVLKSIGVRIQLEPVTFGGRLTPEP